MPDNMTHLTTRVPQQVIEALDDLAKQRRMQTGDDVRRADLVREALETMVRVGADDAGSVGDQHGFGVMVMDAVEKLANEADRQGVEDAQDMAMTLGVTAEKDPRKERIRAFVSKLHGTLQSV